MSFLRDGIDNVRVFALPDGVQADGQSVGVFGAALVAWRSSHTGMLHQVYLNGRFAGATLDPQQRRLVIQAPGSFQSAVRVTVIAVPPAEANVDFTGDLGQAAVCSGRARLTLLRDQTLPLGATANVYCDSGTGQIDYTKPVNHTPISIWPCLQDKAGFGMAQFATGDFGYDSAASVGFGKGILGHGQFGLDADLVQWTGPALPLGEYRFGVRISDAAGNVGPASETTQIAVAPAALPATGLDVATFDQQTNELTLRVTG
jgi:hypothetical protein